MDGAIGVGSDSAHVVVTIEIGKLLGELRRIGFRASKMSSSQGFEIIVLDAQLIKANVTNQPCSDRRQSIALPVGMRCASESKRVIDFLEEVACFNLKILLHQAPECLLM